MLRVRAYDSVLGANDVAEIAGDESAEVLACGGIHFQANQFGGDLCQILDRVVPDAALDFDRCESSTTFLNTIA